MQIDTSRFPLVFLHADGAATSSAEAGLESILHREQRFVLITDHSPADDHDESTEERKQRALFFKRNKDRLRRLCVGAIVIEGGRPMPLPIRLAAVAMGKALGFDFHFVASDAEAIDRGLHLVAQTAG
jgi:hypothetical protein